MAHEAGTEARPAYLVEHYRPGWDVEQLTSCIARVRETVLEMEREGESVHYVRSTIVPNDESFLCVIEAPSEEVVGAAYTRARVPFERITAAISVEG